MSLLIVDGVVLPTPTEYSVGTMDISKAERNANGTMIIERITTKKKIQVGYSYISATELETVMGAVASTFYDVTYLDPSTNSKRTSSFYCGDRNVGLISYVNGVPQYKDFSFDLIER